MFRHIPFILFVLLAASCGDEPTSNSGTLLETVPSDTERLIGSWDLISWSAVTPDGEIVYPYGEAAYGMLIYTSDSTAVLSLSKGDRPVLGSDDYSEMSRDSLLEAYSGFFSYHGTYEVDEAEGRVTHKVEACKIPDWAGREQVRRYSFDGDTLVLSADKVIGLQHELRWKRRVGS